MGSTANCIIIAPKRLKLRLSGSARKSQKRFRDTPRFKFRAVLTHCQPFLSGSVRKRATNSNSNAEKWSIIMQFAVVLTQASFATFRLTSIRGIPGEKMQPDFDSRGVTRPLSAFLRLAMLGCPARRARGQLAAGACAPEPVWDRCGSSSAGACAWLRGCSAGAWGVCWRVCARLPLARLRGSAPRRRFRKVIGGTNRGIPKNGAPEPSST